MREVKMPALPDGDKQPGVCTIQHRAERPIEDERGVGPQPRKELPSGGRSRSDLPRYPGYHRCQRGEGGGGERRPKKKERERG